MVKTINQTLPPSIAEAYRRVLVPRYNSINNNRSQALNSNIYHGPPDYIPVYYMRRARNAAMYLLNEFEPNLSKAGRNSFIFARMSEILSDNFNPVYWHQLTIAGDKCSLDTPTCNLDVGGVAPAYQDPLRRASFCQYGTINQSYDTPAPEAPWPNPFSGWYGEVNATQYKDIWLAQRTFKLNSPVSLNWFHNRPIFAVLNESWDIDASFRGNRMWFSSSVISNWGFSWPYNSTTRYPMRPHVSSLFKSRLRIPPASTPWNHVFVKKSIVDLHEAAWRYWDFNSAYIEMVACPTPPMGRYFARNDSIQCWYDVSVQAYTAKDSI